MRVLVAPDSFKGSMSAVEVCDTVRQALKASVPDCEVDCIPVADGGEGTADSFAFACGAKMHKAEVTGPDFRRVEADFAVMGDTAVIETAKACGLPLVGDKNDPVSATTFGVGELIVSALDIGCRKIILGIGGSATNDGGIGCLSALGVRFLDAKGDTVSPNGLGLYNMKSVDISGMDKRLKECEFTVLCDVENPLYGENGAAFVYAPQKGADKGKVLFLDKALKNYERVVKTSIGADCALLPGSGAAGGMGYGFRVFLGAVLSSGAETILNLCGFDERAESADVIITGEGRFDSQSLMGKITGRVISAANGKPVIMLRGISLLKEARGVSAVFETNPEHLPFEDVLPNCKKSLYRAVFEDVAGFLKKIEKNS